MREIVSALAGGVPVIVFSKGARDWNSLARIGGDVLGIDHGVTLTEARTRVPVGIGLQGNLPPECLVTETPDEVAARVEGILDEMRGRNGHVFNLGHGLLPATKLENIDAVLRTVRREA
jgi:uroporphyrinogen decarboxylase